MTNRRALFAVACLGLLTFGVVMTTLGAVLPSVIERFGIGKAAAGSLFLLNTFAIAIGSLVFGPIVDRWGYKEMLLFATGVTIVGLEAIAFAPSMTVLRVAVVVSGFGGGIINGGTNALVADISVGDRTAALSKLAVFFGVGAVGVPFALGNLLGALSYSMVLASVGALVVIPLLATAVTRFPAPKHAQGFPLAAAGGLLRDPVLLGFGLILFLESGIEITVGGWTTTYFTEELRIGARDALLYLSLYWSGMTVGRMAAGALLRAMSAVRLVAGCITIGIVAALAMIGTHQPWVAAVSAFLIGVGCSATYPVFLGFVGDRYAALSGTAFSVVMVMGLTGGMVVPYLTGVLGGLYGLRASFALVPTAWVVLAGVLAVMSARSSSPTSNRGLEQDRS